jgi:hypothetical protein
MRSLLIVAALAASAHAANPPCAGLSNPIYVQAGDTQLNLLKRLGRALRDNTAKPITLVFSTSGSCTNIDNFRHHTAAITAAMQYVPSTAENASWLPTSATLLCDPPTGGVFPDIGNSALFISSCDPTPPPNTVEEINGPVQAYVMAVPKASSQTAITFEEAYFVFGFGTAGMVMPWIDETEMYIRTITKSTLLTWAANIAVPGAKWHGMRFDGSPMVEAALKGATNPEAAVGILGAEVYDADRVFFNELAFRAKDQYAAYWADSTSTSRDKQNVRDGHYTVWSPTVWMDNIDSVSKLPTNPDARYVIDLIAGHDVMPVPNFEAATIVARVGLVPDCAMRVQRAFDGGPLSHYKPSVSCVCSYLRDVDNSPCATCDSSTPCAAGTTCRNGYCEEF